MPLTVKEQIERSLRKSSDKAFIRREFDRFGSYRQVSRAISDLISEGKLMRAGMGIFVRAGKGISPFKRNFGQEVVYPVTDSVGVGLQALKKLGYQVKMGSLDEDRLTGKSTQIPVVGFIRVKDNKTKRKINVNGDVLRYEIDKQK